MSREASVHTHHGHLATKKAGSCVGNRRLKSDPSWPPSPWGDNSSEELSGRAGATGSGGWTLAESQPLELMPPPSVWPSAEMLCVAAPALSASAGCWLFATSRFEWHSRAVIFVF